MKVAVRPRPALPSTIELVTTGDGMNPRPDSLPMLLQRESFGKRVWAEFSRSARMNEVFRRGFKLIGGECFSCHENKMVRMMASSRGPECVLVEYECLGCGHVSRDVAD